MTPELQTVTERDHDQSTDLELLVLGEDDDDKKESFGRENLVSWLSLDGERPFYTPFYFNSDPAKTEKVPPEVIAKAIYEGKFGNLPTYYTDMYEDYPLLIAAELSKKIKWYNSQTLRPRYLVEIVRLYNYLVDCRWSRGWVASALRFYGPLAINMTGIYKHTSLSIDLANKFPKLMDAQRMPDSIALYMKCVNKWHMDGREQALSTKEISEGIASEWKSTLLDNAPILKASWDSTVNFEQV